MTAGGPGPQSRERIYLMYEEPKIEIEDLEVADVISFGDDDENSDFDTPMF